MPRWLFVVGCTLAFSVPSAMAFAMLWPFYPGRPLPATFNGEAIGIAVAALTLGMGVTMMFNATKAR